MNSDWIWGLIGGSMIGSAAAVYLLGNGRVMGVSGIVGGLLDGSARNQSAERGFFLAGLIGIPAVISFVSGFSQQTHITSNLTLIVLAGVLVGFGTRIGNGCTSGHGVCGMSRLSIRSIIATCTFIGAGAATVLAMRALGAG